MQKTKEVPAADTDQAHTYTNENPKLDDNTHIQSSINRLKAGPQRHEGDVTTEQLKARVKDKIDHETGTTEDAETGKKHKCGRYATRIKSEWAYVKGYEAIKGSKNFQNKVVSDLIKDDEKFSVSLPISQVFKSEEMSLLEGYDRNLNLVNFKGGKLIAVFKRFGNQYLLHTMYPDPIT